MWKEVLERITKNDEIILTSSHIELVRQCLVECIDYKQDIPVDNKNQHTDSSNESRKNIWETFKELEASILSLCENEKNLMEQKAAQKAAETNLSRKSSRRDDCSPHESNGVRKSRRVALPSQKSKEQGIKKTK